MLSMLASLPASDGLGQELPRIQLGEGVPRSILPPHMLEDAGISEAEQATIERALRDMDSDQSEHRAGAVMLLGKYDREQARQAVIRALSDPSARVRRAALVSVTEWNRQAPPEAALPVLRMVADEDVEIRRMASSMVASMQMVQRFARMFQGRGGETEPEALPADIQSGLRDAFSDGDAIVRRNMISQFHAVGVELSPGILLALMLDPDRHVRLEAISLAAPRTSPDAYVEQAKALLDDDDRGVRLHLARQLAGMGDAADSLLLQMAGDEDAEVSAEALLGVLAWRPRADVFDAMLERLQAGGLRRDQGQRFLQWMRRARDLAQPHVVELLTLEDASLRREAARLFFNFRMTEAHPDVLPTLLQDRATEVRRLATGYLHAEPQYATQALLDEMLFSPHADVRKALISLAEHLPAAAEEQLLRDLLLDESMEVRTLALQRIVHRQSEGWLALLRQSLRDPQLEMQRNALNLAMRLPDSQARGVLREFLEAHPDSPLAPLIRRYLANLKQEAQNL